MKFKILRTYFIAQPKQRNNQGFTLIELLVVIIILGVLSVIAIPNILMQVGKARESEAKVNLSAIAIAQQAYFFEKRTFAGDVANLEVSINEGYYSYSPTTLVNSNAVKHQATSKDPANTNTRNYGLGVYHSSGGVFTTILCQSSVPGDTAEAPNINTASCQSGTFIR
jgi:prepilin-type N-terminal cleavage/methylation domain-containing protein